ncbi:MAG: glycosyltransferase family 2 protein [Gemmatimonadaceae bacterium]|nr:glycosyltransferase family 2 protein [Gemmatimonadaceae bacterium]
MTAAAPDGIVARGAVPVSVVIAARNEAGEIGDCVRSVAWAREIIVVENDSTDDTVREAQDAGATVFSHPFTTIGAQRNAAIARATERWILVVDADERGTPALGVEVAGLVGAPTVAATGATTGAPAGATREVGGTNAAPGDGPACRAYRARRRNFFLGREILHGGWERDRPVRLFDASLRYDERPVHEHVIVEGAVGLLRESLLHTPYASLDEYMAKLARYSRAWAEQHHARGRRAGVSDLLLRPVARSMSMLVLRGGWRDGMHGVVLATLAGVSVAAKYAQLWAVERAVERAVEKAVERRGGPPPKTR